MSYRLRKLLASARNTFAISLLAITAFYAPIKTTAQTLVSEEEIAAEFIVNYLDYITYPSNLLYKNNDLTICFLENDETGTYINSYKENTTKKIKIQYKGKRENPSGCDVFYINKKFKSDAPQVMVRLMNYPIFTVSNMDNFSDIGGMSSFIILGDDVLLKANMQNMNRVGVALDPDLLGIMEIE